LQRHARRKVRGGHGVSRGVSSWCGEASSLAARSVTVRWHTHPARRMYQGLQSRVSKAWLPNAVRGRLWVNCLASKTGVAWRPPAAGRRRI